MQAGEPTRAPRKARDHLPAAPVHQGGQGAQAARGDPEEKEHSVSAKGHGGFQLSFNKPVPKLHPWLRRGFTEGPAEERMLFGLPAFAAAFSVSDTLTFYYPANLVRVSPPPGHLP